MLIKFTATVILNLYGKDGNNKFTTIEIEALALEAQQFLNSQKDFEPKKCSIPGVTDVGVLVNIENKKD